MRHAGGCHCGNLRFALETSLPLTALPLRACQCGFCRAHGARSASDPAGTLRFEARDPARVTRYRFGLRLADFLICGACGTYVGAVMEQDGRHYGIVNANGFDEVGQLTQAASPVDYEGETDDQRSARRRARWTPIAGPAP